MALAANQLAEMKGGQVVVKDGKVIGQVALPIAGLMSNKRADVVAEEAASVLDGFYCLRLHDLKSKYAVEPFGAGRDPCLAHI